MRRQFRFAVPTVSGIGLVIAVFLLQGAPALFQSLVAAEAAEARRPRLALCVSGGEKAKAMWMYRADSKKAACEPPSC
jgi:hypothetical protein